MSNARDLALIEKWADIATPVPPQISPTSPKATKLCCCPNRRRYNLKQPKQSTKSTLHARNIFSDNDFTYIDDVPHENDSCNTNSNSNINSNYGSTNHNINSNNNNKNHKKNQDSNNRWHSTRSNDCDSDYDDVVDIVGLQYDGNLAVKLMNECNEQQQQQQKHQQEQQEIWQWQQELSSNNCLAKTQNIQQKERKTIAKNCAVTNRQVSGNNNVAADALRQQQEQLMQQQSQQQQQQQQQQIQRLSNSNEHQFSYKENTLSNKNINNNNNNNNHNNDTTRTPTTIKTTTSASSSSISYISTTTTTSAAANASTTVTPTAFDKNNIQCNYCKLSEPQANNNNNSNNCNSKSVPTQKKMTITTAAATVTTQPNVAAVAPNRKLSECGLTNAATATVTATPTAAAATTTTTRATAASIVCDRATTPTTPTSPTPPARATTPSRLKTVIKTTMVKRSPSHDSDATYATPAELAAAATTSPMSSLPNNSCNSFSNGNDDDYSEPRRSVRERIAAFAAGNEQSTTRNIQHDSNVYNKSNKYAKNQCNNKEKTMTSEVKSAISHSHCNSNNNNKNNSNAYNSNCKQQQQKQQQENQANINNNDSESKSATTAIAGTSSAMPQATCNTSVAASKIKSNADKPCYQSELNDVQTEIAAKQTATVTATKTTTTTTAATATSSPSSSSSSTTQAATSPSSAAATASVHAVASVFSTGCATMPRSRRLPAALSINNSCGNNNNNNNHSGYNNDETAYNLKQYGSNTAAMTVDKKFLSCANANTNASTNANLSAAHKPQNAGDKDLAASIVVSPTTQRKLATLENLDLAHSLDLMDDDGEDPYFALQAYLERVKHEINEVFELRKAQRMQQQQQQQQASQHDEPAEAQHWQQPNQVTATATPTAIAIATATATVSASNGATGVAYVDELSRSTESDSGFDSATGERSKLHTRTSSSNSNGRHEAPSQDTGKGGTNPENPASNKSKMLTTKLRALPPPPLGTNGIENMATAAQLRNDDSTEEVNIWANKFLRDLDNLMSSDKQNAQCSSASTSPTSRSSPMLLSAAAKAAIQSRYGKGTGASASTSAEHSANNGLVLKPEKHTTIPLQSFNLDCGRNDAATASASPASAAAAAAIPMPAATITHVAYMRTLSAPGTECDRPPTVIGNRNSLAVAFHAEPQQRQSAATNGGTVPHNLTNFQSNAEAAAAAATILKIEETAAKATNAGMAAGELKSRRQHRLENDIKTIRNVLLSELESNDSSSNNNNNNYNNNKVFGNGSNNSNNSNNNNNGTLLAAIPNQERINHATTMTTTTTTTAAKTPTTMSPTTTTTSTTTTPTTTTMMTTKMSLLNAEATTKNTIKPPPTSSATTTAKAPGATHLTPVKMHGNNNSNNNNSASYLLHGNDVTKKGSTSTIWTSEESILRSVGAGDEDNNSTSSSACEEAAGVLSSGKSGISLDSSGLDNDNNESGIGTATPPKDISYWKNGMHHDNESVSSLDALRKMKFQKSSSVASSDDPDLLEVLSLCDEPHGSGSGSGADGGNDDAVGDYDGNESHDDLLEHVNAARRRQLKQQQQHKLLQKNKRQQQQQSRQCRQHDSNTTNSTTANAEVDDEADVDVNDADVDDECHDEFETLRFCDCDCTDGDANSVSGNSSHQLLSHSASAANAGSCCPSTRPDTNQSPVVLRRKYSTGTRFLLPSCRRAQKCRSHSLDATASAEHQQLQHHHHLLHQLQQHSPVHGLPPRKLYMPFPPPPTLRNGKERAQLSLALRQEPFQSMLSPTHFHELPSPSSASLHSGHHESLGIQELTTKSNSAPLLLKQEHRKRDDFAAQNLTLRYSRSQSDRYLAEIEAVEACKWLRAAGFPQYAQMYEDHQFPIDLTNVAKDHTNLENDQLQSLYRRLCILNRCATMRLDQTHKPQTPQQKEDSDDENFALSENWTFQPHIRRWSRIGEMGLELPPAGKLNVEKTESSSKESSPDRFDDDPYGVSGAGVTLMIPGGGGACSKSDATDTSLNESGDNSGVRLRRTGSERFKDGAKAFLRRVESIKSRRRKRQNREGVVISGPQVLDLTQLSQRSSMRKPDAVYSTPPSPSAVSPMHTFPKGPFFGNELKVPSHSDNFLSPNRASPKRTPTTPRSMRTSPLHFFSMPMPHLKEGKSDDSSSYYSDSQESSTGGNKLSFRKTPSKARRFLQRTGKVDDIGAHSDSECHHGRKLLIKDANSNTTEVKIKKLTRGGSLNLGKDAKKRDGLRSSSFRSRSTTRKEHKTDDTDNTKRTPVVRWHSFQMEERPHMVFRKCFSQKIEPNTAQDVGIPFAGMSAGQLQIIRKLALVTLTGHMERYCPTHRSGWNWELPKFIKKIKMPDYKDKKVFGVPLLLILQRSGQSLPMAVRAAFRWLQLNALDQVGIFRKSGGKSRITKLREMIESTESTADCMDVFDTQQPYDVADMLKQYFRELPESLLTTKMSETFAAIFQHLPPEVRLDAVQCAVLLLPDENREILYVLLEFLTIVAANAQLNQMTSNNLGVCLAQSIFHSSISTGSASVSASPRRKGGKGSGMPDMKELAEAKASHECLSFMIENYKAIYTASKEKLSKCNFGYMEESKPVPLEALGEGMQFHNWRGYLYECTSATIKEGREKTRGWFSISSQTEPSVDIAYKKVGDGHPLRLWRCITEVEAPPRDVLEYIIKQRASWDASLLQSQTIKKLDDRTEIFQYALDGQLTTDFCVLRSWQTDLPRGACVIVETSIDHAKAKPLFGAVRGVVLASRYLIEPCGGGKSRVMHLARVDIKGKTPEWYNKIYGHICSHYLAKVRLAFKHVSDGPESKV